MRRLHPPCDRQHRIVASSGASGGLWWTKDRGNGDRVAAAKLAADSLGISDVWRAADAGECGIRFPVIIKEKKREFSRN